MLLQYKRLQQNIESLEKIIQSTKNHPNQDITDCGICALSIFLILEDIKKIPNAETQQTLWKNIEQDVDILNMDIEKLLSETNNI